MLPYSTRPAIHHRAESFEAYERVRVTHGSPTDHQLRVNNKLIESPITRCRLLHRAESGKKVASKLLLMMSYEELSSQQQDYYQIGKERAALFFSEAFCGFLMRSSSPLRPSWPARHMCDILGPMVRRCGDTVASTTSRFL